MYDSVLDVRDYKTVRKSLLICASLLAGLNSVKVEELPPGSMTDQFGFWAQIVGGPLSFLVVILSIFFVLRSLEIKLPTSKVKIEFLCGFLPPILLGVYAVVSNA